MKKTYIFLIVSSLLITPVFAADTPTTSAADTIRLLQAQVKSLQTQVTSLTSQLAQSRKEADAIREAFTKVINGGKVTVPVAEVKKPVATSPNIVNISIKNFAFGTPTLTIKAGTKVTWTNNDSAPHTVTGDTGDLINSLTLSPGQSYSVTFGKAGTLNYHCKFHTMMKGTIIVTN